MGIGSSEKIILCDLGSHGKAFQTWINALKPLCEEIMALAIGSEPKVLPTDALMEKAAERAALGNFRANTSDVVR